MGWVGEGGGEREKGGYRGKYLMFIQHKYSEEYSTVAKKNQYKRRDEKSNEVDDKWRNVREIA